MYNLILATCLVAGQAFGAYIVKQTVKNGIVTIESSHQTTRRAEKTVVLKDIRESIAEKDKTEDIRFQEILIPDSEATAQIKSLAHQKAFTPNIAGSEVREIIKQGPDNNRIILTVLGDGYTEEEKEKYFSDVERIVGDMFREVTFKSYLPLFNIYAVFVPSEESGISDLTTKRTAFDLYRSPRGSKRGIMPGNRGAIERALKLVDAYTDYPIIIANDDYYGGLGGRYAISTRSENSGSMVLRHELGHNFSNVGEEYDGGQVYSGANFSRSKDVPWKQWVEGETEVHEAKFLTGSYVWQNLGNEDFSENFHFPDLEDYFFSLKVSSVGWSYEDDVKVYLDGRKLELDGVYTKDRSFFVTKNVEIDPGEHTISVEDASKDGDNVLAYANGYAFPKSYDFTYGKVGAFNVFADGGRQRGYRPTHDQCLMRDMRSMIFCPVDQENIWLKFLDRVNVIDRVKVEGDSAAASTANLSGLDFKWFKLGSWGKRDELTHLRGKRSVSGLEKGEYAVEATFSSPEIRKQSESLKESKEFEIK